jgi:hypothetical protein
MRESGGTPRRDEIEAKRRRTWRVGVPVRIWGDGVVAWSGQARVNVEEASAADPTVLAPILTRPSPINASPSEQRAGRPCVSPV